SLEIEVFTVAFVFKILLFFRISFVELFISADFTEHHEAVAIRATRCLLIQVVEK
ncbi:unnamed protein product, partial [Callosobruchus maculatus]